MCLTVLADLQSLALRFHKIIPENLYKNTPRNENTKKYCIPSKKRKKEKDFKKNLFPSKANFVKNFHFCKNEIQIKK